MDSATRNLEETVGDPLALGDEIARMAAHLDAATHRLLTCIRAFDASGEWGRQGALSCAHWLSWRIGLDPGTAREKVRVARALANLPLIDDGLRRGMLSFAKVRALSRVANADNEAALVEAARFCTGAQLERLCRGLKRVIDVTRDGDRLDDRRFLKTETLDNGMVRLTAVLHPDEAALVNRAIEGARRASVTGDVPDSAEARRQMTSPVDALVDVVRAFLATEPDAARAPSSAPGTELVVHLEPDVLVTDGTLVAALDDGNRVSAETLRRLGCDCTVRPLHRAEDGTASVGRGTRVVTPTLRRALWARDRGCCFPGCTNRLFMHAHHIRHWAHGGPTTPDNLALLCSTHHRLVHEGGFQVMRAEDASLAFRDPHGRLIESAPRAPLVSREGHRLLEAMNDAAGVQLDARTGMPGWDGEPIDYDWALDALVRQGAAA